MNTHPQKQSRKPIFFIAAIAAVVIFFGYTWLFKPSEAPIVQKVCSQRFSTIVADKSAGGRGAKRRLTSRWHYHIRAVLSRWASQGLRRNQEPRPFFSAWLPYSVRFELCKSRSGIQVTSIVPWETSAMAVCLRVHTSTHTTKPMVLPQTLSGMLAT
jgi:hypothetical protein